MDHDGFMALANIVTAGDAAKLQVAEEVFKECSGVADADRCELAIKLGGCVKEGAMKRKMDYGL